MNRDEIAQMMQDSAGNSWGTEAHFQRFAALFAAAAKAEEREACASVCEEQEELRGHTPFDCAAAIRARSKQ